MNKRLEAVIFDMDGVIVDTDELYFIVNKAIADMLSIPFTYEDNEKIKGIRRMEIIEMMVERSGKDYSTSAKQELARLKNEHYLSLIENMDQSHVFPGMINFIEELKCNGLKVGLASSSSNQKKIIEKLGLTPFFDVMIDPYLLKRGKPDPEIFLTAADRLGVSYENCVAIEDGEAGMRAILATEMFSIGVGNGNEWVKQANWHVTHTTELTLSNLIERFH
ncbi:beta-phosphoglucomutase [Litchfieldia alkalitelluris]|uniref:beta-phosphoglucomutase n=1 Tax=Litchfieldia alkalitelluris TaxID=304268 RepID=UPI0009979946|nr:beta-phosphoglucomutase [Litchfieldia alkalitelluris]